MNTECKTESIQFHALGSREVRGNSTEETSARMRAACCYEKQKNGRGF